MSSPYSVNLEGPYRLGSPTRVARAGVVIGATCVYGEIHYTDAFKAQRITKYQFTQNENSGPARVTTDLTFAEQGGEAR
jgi:hypothetical protein